MRVFASAGCDRSWDLRDYCHGLRLTAETDEEARWLAALHRVVLGQTDGLPCLPGTHRWVTRRVGGSPDLAESQERVCYCDVCGWEASGDERGLGPVW